MGSSSIQSASGIRLFVTPWTAAHQASLSITSYRSWLKLMSIESVMPSNHLIHPLSSPFPPVFNLSQHQGLFKWVSSSHQMAKVLETQLQHQSFQWIFRIDFLEDGLVGSPCSPRDSQESPLTPQFKGIKSSALSFLYSPTLTSIHDYWKIIALTRWTFVDKVMSLLLNMLSRLVITFLPRSKRLLTSRLRSPSAVILEPLQNKVSHYFHCFPSIFHEVMGPDAMILVFWMLSFQPTSSLSSFTFIKKTFYYGSYAAFTFSLFFFFEVHLNLYRVYLRIRKPRLREVKWAAQGHDACQELNRTRTPECGLFPLVCDRPAAGTLEVGDV